MYDVVKEYINDLEFVKGRNNIAEYGRNLLDEMKKLLAIAEQKEDFDNVIGRWISVKDELPEDEELTVVMLRSKKNCENVIKISRYWEIHKGWTMREDVCYWMRLPKV